LHRSRLKVNRFVCLAWCGAYCPLCYTLATVLATISLVDNVDSTAPRHTIRREYEVQILLRNIYHQGRGAATCASDRSYPAPRIPTRAVECSARGTVRRTLVYVPGVPCVTARRASSCPDHTVVLGTSTVHASTGKMAILPGT
jgi:hypothetical protein